MHILRKITPAGIKRTIGRAVMQHGLRKPITEFADGLLRIRPQCRQIKVGYLADDSRIKTVGAGQCLAQARLMMVVRCEAPLPMINDDQRPILSPARNIRHGLLSRAGDHPLAANAMQHVARIFCGPILRLPVEPTWMEETVDDRLSACRVTGITQRAVERFGLPLGAQELCVLMRR